MLIFLDRCQSWLHNPRIVFPTLAFFVSGSGILLLLGGVFPLGGVNLIFWTILCGLACLYRPNWGFLFLLALLPFETLNLIPTDWGGMMLRPYQWLFLLLIAALTLRLISGRTSWPFFHFHPVDGLLGLLPLGALISGFAHSGEGIRLGVIVLSFFALYLLGRVFFKTTKDLFLAASTFTAAGLPVLIYGLAQNVAFEFGGTLTAVMPGRPNATFAEPDWLGFFSVVLFLFVFAALFRATSDLESQTPNSFFRTIAITLILILIAILLVLSVSRSAWLALVIALVVAAGLTLLQSGRRALRAMFQTSELAVIAFILALVCAIEIPLTRFDLLNRAESTATGLQEITIACDQDSRLPVAPIKIQSLDELLVWQCRHIRLEEIEGEERAGKFISTVYRTDPNVAIRSDIYRRTWEEIRSHPVLGIGWGNIGSVLGRDENGSAYNASNLWLEVWLGAGLIGLAGSLGLMLWVLVQIVVTVRKKIPVSSRQEQYSIVSALLVAFCVFNLFNAGLLIGFVWIWLAALPVIFPKKTTV